MSSLKLDFCDQVFKNIQNADGGGEMGVIFIISQVYQAAIITYQFLPNVDTIKNLAYGFKGKITELPATESLKTPEAF